MCALRELLERSGIAQAAATGDPALLAAAQAELASIDSTPRDDPIVEIVSKVQPVIDAITNAFRISDGVDAAMSPVTGLGVSTFKLHNTPESRAHNIICVRLYDAMGMLLDMIEPADAYVAVLTATGAETQQELDEAVDIDIQMLEPGTLQMTYVVSNPATETVTLQVHVCGVEIAGSPFALKAF